MIDSIQRRIVQGDNIPLRIYELFSTENEGKMHLLLSLMRKMRNKWIWISLIVNNNLNHHHVWNLNLFWLLGCCCGWVSQLRKNPTQDPQKKTLLSLMGIHLNPPSTNPKIHGYSNYMHLGVAIANNWDLNGQNWQLNSKEWPKLLKSRLMSIDSLTLYMI